MRYLEGNILDATADAIILTIDGSSAKSMGSVAAQMVERLKRDWRTAEEDIEFPIPLGNIKIMTVYEGSVAFRHVFLLSAIDYDEQVTPRQRQEFVQKGLIRALTTAAAMGLKSVACPHMRFGWRVSDAEMAQTMLKTHELCEDNGITLTIYQRRNPHGKRRARGSRVRESRAVSGHPETKRRDRRRPVRLGGSSEDNEVD